MLDIIDVRNAIKNGEVIIRPCYVHEKCVLILEDASSGETVNMGYITKNEYNEFMWKWYNS